MTIPTCDHYYHTQTGLLVPCAAPAVFVIKGYAAWQPAPFYLCGKCATLEDPTDLEYVDAKARKS